MSQLAKYFVLVLFLSSQAFGQPVVNRKLNNGVYNNSTKNNYGIGAGVAKSVLYLTRNVNSDNDAIGINTVFTFDKGNYFRGTFEYTYYGSIDIQPTWLDVKAQTIEANLSVISKSKNKKIYFYPIAGLSYNLFKGFYTGINDFQNLGLFYQKNHEVRTNWLGINAGLGADYNFRNGAIYVGYKMRLGRTAEFRLMNIMDVFMVAGLKFYLNKAALNKIFRGTHSRYSFNKPSKSK